MVATFFGGAALFIGFKWRAVMARSEAAKRAGTKEINYSVAPGRSGKLFLHLTPTTRLVLVSLAI